MVTSTRSHDKRLHKLKSNNMDDNLDCLLTFNSISVTSIDSIDLHPTCIAWQNTTRLDSLPQLSRTQYNKSHSKIMPTIIDSTWLPWLVFQISSCLGDRLSWVTGCLIIILHAAATTVVTTIKLTVTGTTSSGYHSSGCGIFIVNNKCSITFWRALHSTKQINDRMHCF